MDMGDRHSTKKRDSSSLLRDVQVSYVRLLMTMIAIREKSNASGTDSFSMSDHLEPVRCPLSRSRNDEATSPRIR